MSLALPRFLAPKALLLPLVLVAGWWLLAAAKTVNPNLLPAPGTVLTAASEHLLTVYFWNGLGESLLRTFIGFSIAAVVGLMLGVVIGVSRGFEWFAGPIFHAFRQIAPFAWIPLIGAWFGTGQQTKVVFIAIASLAPVVINTIEGVRGVTREHLELARVLEVPRWRLLTGIILPSAAPQIFTGLQLCMVVAWLATVGAEFFLQFGPGVTFVLQEGRSQGRMELVMFGVAVLGVVGFGLTRLIAIIEARVLRWRPSGRPSVPTLS